MKKIRILILLSVTTLNIKAQSWPVDLSATSESLKKHAHSIKREESIVFDVRSADKAYYKVHEVITVLDESAKSELFFHTNTDKFHSLEEITITLYTAAGSKIKKYTKSDLTSFNDGEGLVSDGKVYLLNIPNNVYPVTVEYNSEYKFNGMVEYPDYVIQSVGQSVEKSSYTVIVPADLDLRYKAVNTDIKPTISTENNKKTYVWSTHDMKALRYEEGSVNDISYYPRVMIAPNKFELDGYPGEMTSWQKYGDCYTVLLKRSNDLSESRKEFFRTLVKDAANDKEKAAIIYKYVQQNCRYVLILLGIGGLKPFEASFVDKKKYGDCKALSNYTKSCLDAVGIKSYYAMVNADYDKSPVDPDFPSDPFNHVILFVPIGKDSVWLECTSNTKEFGVLGSFTENRNALLVTENGGQLVSTPKSIASSNILRTYCVVDIKQDGSGKAAAKLQTKGEFKYPSLTTEKKDDQKEYIVNHLGFVQPDEFSLDEKKDGNYDYTINMDIEKIPSFSAGSKMFLSPRINKIWNMVLPDAFNRTQDYYFHNPFIKDDTTVYRLPQGYTVEVLPEAKKINFNYGNFNTVYTYDKDKNEVISISHLELTNYHISAAEYNKAKIFFDAVLAEYNGKIVIKKTN